MSEPSDNDRNDLRSRIIGLGERSHKKSYYPELMKKLKELERFRAILDQSNDCFFMLSFPEGRLIESGITGRDMFFQQTEEGIGKSFIDLIVPAHRRPVEDFFAAAGRSEKDELTVEVDLVTRKSEEIPFEIKLKKVSFENEFYFIAVARDISFRRKSEEKLIEAQKMDSIGNLAAGIAHDFNNMLCGIMGFSTLMLRKEKDQENILFLQNIITCGKKAGDLTSKLLAFGRRGKKVVEPVLLNEIVVNVVALIRGSIDKADEIEVSTSLMSDLWQIEADPAQITQIVMNLCVNAREAMNGCGTITVSTRNLQREDLNMAQYPELAGEKFVELVVSDTGHGIDEKLKARIFEPFFTTKQDGEKKGTGLGLAMVYGIVRSHRGAIDLQSEPGKGATFRIIFPVAGQVRAEEKPEQKAVPCSGGTILVVEDENSVLVILDEILRKLGYQTLLAADGRRAVEVFKENSAAIDGVILDMRLPLLSAREVFLEMRSIRPGIKVLLTTGYGNNVEAQELVRMGINGILLKPFNMKEVEAMAYDLVKKA
mgnify:CR=1 FL=1